MTSPVQGPLLDQPSRVPPINTSDYLRRLINELALGYTIVFTMFVSLELRLQKKGIFSSTDLDDFINYLTNLIIGESIFVLAWLQNGCKITEQDALDIERQTAVLKIPSKSTCFMKINNAVAIPFILGMAFNFSQLVLQKYTQDNWCKEESKTCMPMYTLIISNIIAVFGWYIPATCKIERRLENLLCKYNTQIKNDSLWKRSLPIIINLLVTIVMYKNSISSTEEDKNLFWVNIILIITILSFTLIKVVDLEGKIKRLTTYLHHRHLEKRATSKSSALPSHADADVPLLPQVEGNIGPNPPSQVT